MNHEENHCFQEECIRVFALNFSANKI